MTFILLTSYVEDVYKSYFSIEILLVTISIYFYPLWSSFLTKEGLRKLSSYTLHLQKSDLYNFNLQKPSPRQTAPYLTIQDLNIYFDFASNLYTLCPVDVFCHLMQNLASIDAGSLWARPGVIYTLFRLHASSIKLAWFSGVKWFAERSGTCSNENSEMHIFFFQFLTLFIRK